MSLFNIKLPLNSEYVDLVNDVLMITSALFFAYIIFKTASKKKSIFDSYLEFYVFIVFGVLYHHLLVKKLIQFV